MEITEAQKELLFMTKNHTEKGKVFRSVLLSPVWPWLWKPQTCGSCINMTYFQALCDLIWKDQKNLGKWLIRQMKENAIRYMSHIMEMTVRCTIFGEWPWLNKKYEDQARKQTMGDEGSLSHRDAASLKAPIASRGRANNNLPTETSCNPPTRQLQMVTQHLRGSQMVTQHLRSMPPRFQGTGNMSETEWYFGSTHAIKQLDIKQNNFIKHQKILILQKSYKQTHLQSSMHAYEVFLCMCKSWVQNTIN